MSFQSTYTNLTKSIVMIERKSLVVYTIEGSDYFGLSDLACAFQVKIDKLLKAIDRLNIDIFEFEIDRVSRAFIKMGDLESKLIPNSVFRL